MASTILTFHARVPTGAEWVSDPDKKYRIHGPEEAPAGLTSVAVGNASILIVQWSDGADDTQTGPSKFIKWLRDEARTRGLTARKLTIQAGQATVVQYSVIDPVAVGGATLLGYPCELEISIP